MRDPGAVVAVAGLALLVGAHLGEGGLVGRRIVLDRDLRRHAAHRERAAAVAGLDQQLANRPAGRRRPSPPAPRSGSTHSGLLARAVLMKREDVVPAAAVQPGDVVAQLVEDLVHLEGRRQRLDQHRRLDRAVRQAERRPAAWTNTSFHSRASRWLSIFGR